VPPVTLAELAYAAALRGLDLQERAIEALRARTGTLLAATSLTASFLGAATIQHTGRLGLLGSSALIALAISILACIYVLLPKRGFVFSVNAERMYETLYDCREDAEEVRRRLVYWLESYWTSNQQKADVLGRYFAVAAAALSAQLLLWSIALTATV
jgi:predicted small integral membrane protein